LRCIGLPGHIPHEGHHEQVLRLSLVIQAMKALV
jgi:hypothetical protein